MSNSWFLDGLFLSIDRKELAAKNGYTPSANYFAGAYLIDPERGISYNSTEAHKNAVSGYYPETYGYNFEAAKVCFQTAVTELVADGSLVLGTAERPTEIHIELAWQAQVEITRYGDDVKQYFEKAFNDSSVCGGKVKLVVDHFVCATWSDVYYKKMMVGQFDFGSGGIEGNTLNPLNFMEVLKSDNSAGFTLNWGLDTNECSEEHHISYDDKFWSFDALWAAADHGALVKNGSTSNPVTDGFVDMTRPGNWEVTDDGVTITIDFYTCGGIDGNEVKFTFEDLTIYDGAGGEYVLSDFCTVVVDPQDPTHYIITLTLDAEAWVELNAIVGADLGAPEGMEISEDEYVGKAVTEPLHPYAAIIGGAKVSDKIGVIENLLDKVDTLLIGGGMANTFLVAGGCKLGKSLVELEKVIH